MNTTRDSGERPEQPAFRLDPVRERDVAYPKGRDEINVATHPIAVMSRKAAEGISTAVFESPSSVVDGVEVKRRWTIEAGPHGLPIAADVPVVMALLQIAHDEGYASRKVPFTLYGLAQRLGLKGSGADYTRILESIRRLNGTVYKAEEAWYDVSLGEVVRERAVSIVGDYDLARNKGRATLPSWVMLGDTFFDQIKNGGTKPIDMIALRRMRTAVGQALYRYLDRQRGFGKATHEIGLDRLAHEHIGLSTDYYPSQIKRELDSAHVDLVEMGFLASWNYRKGKSGEVVAYAFGEGTSKYGRLLQQLIDRGVSRNAARLLMAVPPSEIDARYELVEAQIEELDALIAAGHKIPSPGGWLRKAIEERYDHSRSKAKRASRASSPPQPLQARLVDVEDTNTASTRTPDEARAILGAERVAEIVSEVEIDLLANSMSYKLLAERGGAGAPRRLAAAVDARLIEEASRSTSA